MIFTFYSYKGGVGRSMALANMAELFYRAGLKVLMIDWDLEAPGLEIFFKKAEQMDDILGQLGVIDMLLTYKEQMAQPLSVDDDEELQLPPLEEFVTPIRGNGADLHTTEGAQAASEGKLDLLTAGDRSAENFEEYAQSVINFDWSDFYQNWEGERYIEWLRKQMKEQYDVILVDSRTGVTEMGGICTYHLADTIIMFCAPNRQNLDGTSNMAQKFTDPIWPTLRHGRPLDVLVVPSRIERAESHFLDEFQKEFISRFKDVVPHKQGLDIKQLWELAIPYIPKYVYQETIAVRESDLASAEDLATAYHNLWQLLDRLRLRQLVCKEPTAAAHELALAFSRLDYQKDKTELARIASLVERFSQKLDPFSNLLIYARCMGNVARNDLESAAIQLKNAFGEQNQVEIQGVNLPIPTLVFEKQAVTPLPLYRTHPFIYGRPVRPNEFLNRENELRIIFNRLRNGESTAIVGSSRLGKTSLLLKVADKSTEQAYLGDSAQKLIVSMMDLELIGSELTPAIFWQEALEPLQELGGHQITHYLQKAAESGYTRRQLERLLRHLALKGCPLVLLLDDFDQLLSHPNFQESGFFALLRSLSIRTAGLVLLLASRLSVAEMNHLGWPLLTTGSPFFSIFIEMKLRPFDEQSVGLLLDQADKALSSDERRFIRRVAGRHPFLLQAMAASMIESTGNDRPAPASERFYRQVTSYFENLWNTLDDHARTTAVILSLIELTSRASGKKLTYGELEESDAFGFELQRLAKLGLAEQVCQEWPFDREHLFTWREKQWTVGTQAFLWWVRNTALSGSKQIDSNLTQMLKPIRNLNYNKIYSVYNKIYNKSSEWSQKEVRELAQALWDEVVAQK